jgi:hypothetical protein
LEVKVGGEGNFESKNIKMTETELIEIAKEQIKAGKPFEEIETGFILNQNKSIGESARIVGLAKEELGIDANSSTEEFQDQIRLEKNSSMGV